MGEGQRAIVLARTVAGMPRVEDFAPSRLPIPVPADGELLLRVHWLSIDPWLRPVLAGRHLTPPPPVGGVIPGHGIGEVVESRAPGYAPGDLVVADVGWQEWTALPAAGVRRIDPALAPPSAWLGVLGLPGLTAWAGLRTIGKPAPGETVVVSAAAGAVGSLAAQLARSAGARVVGIAGDPEKCRIAVEDFGCAACVSHRDPDLVARLRATCPDGIDVYFDNVGGRVLEAAIGMLRRHARVVLCGLIDQYNADVRPPGPNLGPVIAARATLTGLVVYDHLDRFPEFVAEVGPALREGRIRHREDVAVGLESAPRQFVAMLEGRNRGKALVRLDTGDAS
jgi:NADPH-dependent curcumin reductase CurA